MGRLPGPARSGDQPRRPRCRARPACRRVARARRQGRRLRPPRRTRSARRWPQRGDLLHAARRQPALPARLAAGPRLHGDRKVSRPLHRRPDLRERLHPPRLTTAASAPAGVRRPRRPQRTAAGRLHRPQAQSRCCRLPVHRRASPAQGRRRAAAGAGRNRRSDFPCAPSSSAPGRMPTPSTASPKSSGSAASSTSRAPCRRGLPSRSAAASLSHPGPKACPTSSSKRPLPACRCWRRTSAASPRSLTAPTRRCCPRATSTRWRRPCKRSSTLPSRRRRAPRACRAAVAERFTVERAAGEVLAFYAERLGR